MAVSEDVLRLVRTVEQLPTEDQDKILRLVDLLSLVPPSVQERTQQMLRALLASSPASKGECVAGVDDLIEYLERHTSVSPQRRGLLNRLEIAGSAKVRLS
ncbi:MAG TPA: hypothetical protein VE907_01450 [Gammaproteobacteria bacterium]|nr:hypothetical protein [Gammaproteobacteria bacterium]